MIDAGTKTFAVLEPNIFSPPQVEQYVFSAPDVNAGSMSILFFRLHPEGETSCTVEMSLNDSNIFTRTLSPGIERSMHVAIPQGLLEASDNNLSLSKVDGGAVLLVSEIVVFFQTGI